MLAAQIPQADFVCVDTETASNQRSSLCAIGLAVVAGGEIVAEAVELVNPQTEFSHFNTLVHGLDAEAVSGARVLPEVWPHLVSICSNQTLVCHNAAFDVSVLRCSAGSYDLEGFDAEVVCSLRLARVIWPGAASYGLAYLSREHGFDLDHHDALSDARACARLTMAMVESARAPTLAGLIHRIGMRPGRIGPDSFRPVLTAGPTGKLRNRSADPGADESSPLYGLTICFTGALLSMHRDEAAELVAKSGGDFKNSMSKKVDLLVVGDADYLEFADGQRTGKLQKAEDLRVEGEGPEVVREVDFLRMLDG